MLTQAIHSFEEWYFDLWRVYPPAAFLSNLHGNDPSCWFGLLNVVLVMTALICFIYRHHDIGIRLAWFWVILELINGSNHLFNTILINGYFSWSLHKPFPPSFYGTLGK